MAACFVIRFSFQVVSGMDKDIWFRGSWKECPGLQDIAFQAPANWSVWASLWLAAAWGTWGSLREARARQAHWPGSSPHALFLSLTGCCWGSQWPVEKAFKSFPGLPGRTTVFNQRQGISATMCWNNFGFLTNQMGMTTRYEVGYRRVQWTVSLINSDRGNKHNRNIVLSRIV